MRNKARKILFDTMEYQGCQWVIFNEDEPNRNNGIIESVIDAMVKFKNLDKDNISANNKALIWWSAMSLDEQVKRAYEWNGEVAFNLTLRDVSFLHQQELKK